MEQPTDEQIKQACEMLKAAKQRGFINHLHANGKSAAEIEKLHARYVEDDAKREEYLGGLRTAILGAEAS
jgi:tRNA A37 threonylcarbamoyladenosine synthetase subunit TsaC/SUA5/YrdC